LAATVCAPQIVHAQAQSQRQLWRINADGGGLALLAETPGSSCGSPDWSPDGTLVAYDTWPVTKTWSDAQVAVVRADGSQPPRLFGPGAMPSFSPDGKQLVFHTYAQAYDTDHIVIMNADGTGRETILDHWGSPRWSPRGNRIASILGGNIALFHLDTGRERTILRGPYAVRHGFAVSPDGLRFCFPISDGGLGLATLDERTMQASVRVLVRSGTCAHASWAPDGKRIVFSWDRDKKSPYQLHLLDVDANDPPLWLPGQERARNNLDPDWSPDGKTIVFSSHRLPASQ
jgi:Tol biopolymer transport system component